MRNRLRVVSETQCNKSDRIFDLIKRVDVIRPSSLNVLGTRKRISLPSDIRYMSELAGVTVSRHSVMQIDIYLLTYVLQGGQKRKPLSRIAIKSC